tara:strand:- start:37 stop:303 length:267 start_codon:yes stop_codon:yes gene_type:complete
MELINNKYIKSSMNDIFINLNKKMLMLELKHICNELKDSENQIIYWGEEMQCEMCDNMCKIRSFGFNDNIPCCVKCAIICINDNFYDY